MGITAKEVIGVILFIGLILFLKFFMMDILIYGYHYAIGDNVCNGKLYEACPADRVFSCDSQIGGVCDIKTATETCEEKGLHTCQEKCWNKCSAGQTWICDDQLGGQCKKY